MTWMFLFYIILSCLTHLYWFQSDVSGEVIKILRTDGGNDLELEHNAIS